MLISIIVPVYNASQYLPRCIESLSKQRYHEIEIIMVNDGSSDNSGKICDDFARTHPNVTVVHQPNGGVSSARNCGLDIAHGEWIAFVDADDVIDEDYIANLAKETPTVDWILGGYYTSKGQKVVLDQALYNCDELYKFWESHFHRLYATVPWGKLFKGEIIRNNLLRFDTNIRLGEDLVFNVRYLGYCHSVSLIPYSEYIYTTGAVADERYNLSVDEIKYTIDKLKFETQWLSRSWEYDLYCDNSIRVLIATFPLSRIRQSKLNEYYHLYSRCFPQKTICDFWDDELCSPLRRAIRQLKYCIKTFNVREVFNLIKFINQHHSAYPTKIQFYYLTDKYLFQCCKYLQRINL